MYCPGHARVSGNERADRLASTADITSGLQLGRAEVLRGWRNFLNMDRPQHHSIDHLKERGVETGRAEIPLPEVGNDVCSTRQTLVLFQGQPLGTYWETGRSAYGPFRALRCHLELKLKLKLKLSAVSFWKNVFLCLLLSLRKTQITTFKNKTYAVWGWCRYHTH